MNESEEAALTERLVALATPGIRDALFNDMRLMGGVSELRQALRDNSPRLTLIQHRASILEVARGLLGPEDRDALERILDMVVEAGSGA